MRVLHYSLPLTILPGLAAAQPGQGWPMHDGWMWWMPFHGLLSLLMVAAVVVGVIFLVRHLWAGGGSDKGSISRSNALDHLDERYARGEIDRDEYLQRKKDIAGR